MNGPLATNLASSTAAVAMPEVARELADASISANTRRAYGGAMRRLQDHLDGAPLTDASLAAYLSALFEAGCSPATASMVVAAVRFQARLTGSESPVGPRTDRVLAGYRRAARDRGTGQVAGRAVVSSRRCGCRSCQRWRQHSRSARRRDHRRGLRCDAAGVGAFHAQRWRRSPPTRAARPA